MCKSVYTDALICLRRLTAPFCVSVVYLCFFGRGGFNENTVLSQFSLTSWSFKQPSLVKATVHVITNTGKNCSIVSVLGNILLKYTNGYLPLYET